MMAGQNYHSKKSKAQIKQAHSIRNVQQYGSKKYEREQLNQKRAKSAEKSKSRAFAAHQKGPPVAHYLVESITFGAPSAKKPAM